VQTCPTGALKFGERADLIAEAHARIQAHPERYVDHVYGETENGGTSYLILSHVPFTDLGLPALGAIPVKDISEAVMGVTIPFAVGWGALLTGVTVGFEMSKKRQAQASPKEVEEPAAAPGDKK